MPSAGRVRGADRFLTGEWASDDEDVPYLIPAQASIFCETDAISSYGTHSIVIGKVHHVAVRGQVAPLLYQDGQYTRRTRRRHRLGRADRLTCSVRPSRTTHFKRENQDGIRLLHAVATITTKDNTRNANQFVADITAEALYADQLGMHSAWIGEHHFNSLGVNSSPEMVLAYIAARTKHIRLAPAVTVLPLHHPIRVAEQWATLDLLSGGRVDFAAGRGYDRREYLPFGMSFDDNQAIFDEGMEVLRKLWSSGGKRIDHKGKHYQFEDVRDHARSRCRSRCRSMSASFSKPSIELAARLNCGLIVAPFAAAMSFGGLKQVADLYHESCAKYGTKPRPADVQLLHALRRQCRAGEGAARAPDPLLQGMRDPVASRAIRRPRRRAIAISSTWWSGCTR